ncbi:guanine nucleotide exchange factor subunit RIC1-like [Tubulanus polymorphus]|uniref:guanine nucleotide exchange factor subunit RIC1-like n=1 Tax=Tubulanus polymorphus TaxID=672921 RepID=UPI003DA63CCD
MYFTIEWPITLRLPHSNPVDIVNISANRERILFAVLTANALSIWFCKPSVQIVCFERSANSLTKFGVNESTEWKPDSSLVAVTTSLGYIIFYKIDVDTAVPHHHCLYTQHEGGKHNNKKELCDIHTGDGIPALLLSQLSYMQVPGGIKCVVSLREDLMVATRTGMLLRIRWDGFINDELGISLSNVPFATDLQHSRACNLSDDTVVYYISDMEYSSSMGGFAVVLSNGRAAFLTATSPKFEPSQVIGVWAESVTNATCVAVNHKYRLIAFGCQNGDGLVYCIDEVSGALMLSHKLIVSSKDYPDAALITGGVSLFKWTPDGCALSMSWSNGGYAVWSVYGALLVCTLASDFSGNEYVKESNVNIQSMEWGPEGYYLWLAIKPAVDCNDSKNIMQIPFVKSALTMNPCSTNHEHLCLQGADRLFLNTEVKMLNQSNGIYKNGMVLDTDLTMSISTSMTDSTCSANFLLSGNKQWQIVPFPLTYLGCNWPIRLCALDRTGQYIAIAGKTGLCHYAPSTKKWKLFGNETQEHDMVVSGGMTWWKDFICCGCVNILDQRDELRFYPRSSKLDNTFAHIIKVPSPILLLNTFHDILIVFCADCHIMLYNMERKNSRPNPTIEVQKIQEVAIGTFIPQAVSVVSVTLTSVRTESAMLRGSVEPKQAESILLNYAGKLLMFQRDKSGHHVQPKDGKYKPLPFCAPLMVASSVENMWSTPRTCANKKYLLEALWLSCGAHGMKVWLPLLPREEVKTPGYMSRRIMLPFNVEVYPLTVLFEDAVILGVTCENIFYYSADSELSFPFSTLERTSQIYLHHILRQLLRRNLGSHALEIARCCTDLPYFGHVLELLLHEVLEEEATSKEPIPDPLLPRVVAFIQEFPEYLQTIVHCARKTEVALWPYLFTTAGNPKDLFEECLMSKNLDTAASYLIILQNLEIPLVSRQHATLLLDSALEQCKWDLARDLVRFLKAIDPAEAETPPHFTPMSRGASSTSMYPGTTGPFHTPPISPSESSAFAYNSSSRNRSTSLPEAAKDPTKLKDRKTSKTESQSVPKRQSPAVKEENTAEQFFIDVILSRHARKLLSQYHLRDLGYFSANLDDYQLVGWLNKERLRAAKVEDFVAALKLLHHDFNWPLPIMTHSAYHQMHKSLSVSNASSLATDSDFKSDGTSPVSVLTGEGIHASFPLNLSTPDLLTGQSDVLLKPQISHDDVSLATTELSESSSFLGDADLLLDQVIETPLSKDFERLTLELANKGPQQSEIQLRYLFHIMLEAGCLEWALLISVLLRDVMNVVRVVNTASLTETAIETVGRMREGLSFLDLWADTECLGFKPFLNTIQNQRQILEKILEQNPLSSRLSSTSSHRLSNSSLDSSAASDELKSAINQSLIDEVSPEKKLNVDISVGLMDETEKENYEGCVLS